MSKKFKNTPAAYPESSSTEINAASTLRYILDPTYIKGDIRTMDKIPNVDGTLEITDTNQIPIGKIELQVKTLDQKNLSQPKYQCSKEFLAYCERSIMPVILIVVDVTNAKAYWLYISSEVLTLLSAKIKKNTVSVEIPLKNVIDRNNNFYVIKWISIIEERQNLILDYPNQVQRVNQLEAENTSITKITKSSILGESSMIIKEIHIFLDYYNTLLDRDFKTVKQICYPTYWKIGVAYSEYNENSTSFILYPIHITTNDTQIKKIDADSIHFLETVISYISFNRENPIKSRPENYAYQLIEKDTLSVVEEKLLPKDFFLSREYLFGFIDHFCDALGLPENAQNYNINNLHDRLFRLIPILVECVNPRVDIDSPYFSIDLDFVNDSLSKEKMAAAMKVANDKFDRGHMPSHSPSIHSERFNLFYIQQILRYCSNNKIINIERLYYKPSLVNLPLMRLNQEQILHNIRIAYENLPTSFDNYMKEFFPLLREDLRFFYDFDALIVVADLQPKFPGAAVELDIYMFNSESNLNKVYVFQKENAPTHLIETNKIDLWKIGFVLDRNNLKLRSTRREFFHERNPNPVFDLIPEFAKERLRNFFNLKKAQTNI